MRASAPFAFLRILWANRVLIARMTVYDLKMRYLGSAMGILWGFVSPLVTISVYWVVFKYGLKAQAPSGGDFGPWFITGILPWFLFNEVMLGGCGAILEKPYLVQKLVFRVELLPFIKLLSSLLIHAILLIICIAAFSWQARAFTADIPQLLYYMAGLSCIALGGAFLFSALTVFIRDITQILQVILQLLFWLTPILWTYSQLPKGLRRWFRLNPLACFVEGYRTAILGGEPFWLHPSEQILFWGTAAAALFGGAFIFLRLRPHFADVL
jgi:ABC-type polysaccharide/polyol phosphate export permease